MYAGATETSFNRVRDAVRIPMYGCDCYAYGLLAAGLADVVVEADLKPYDYMALVPIIQVGQGVDEFDRLFRLKHRWILPPFIAGRQ